MIAIHSYGVTKLLAEQSDFRKKNPRIEHSPSLTLSDLNLFKGIKKRNLKHNQTSEKQIDTSFFFSPT